MFREPLFGRRIKLAQSPLFDGPPLMRKPCRSPPIQRSQRRYVWNRLPELATEMAQTAAGTYSNNLNVVPVMPRKPSCRAAPIQYRDRKVLRMVRRSRALSVNHCRNKKSGRDLGKSSCRGLFRVPTPAWADRLATDTPVMIERLWRGINRNSMSNTLSSLRLSQEFLALLRIGRSIVCQDTYRVRRRCVKRRARRFHNLSFPAWHPIRRALCAPARLLKTASPETKRYYPPRHCGQWRCVYIPLCRAL
jgi:hypothetical protein